MLKTFIKGREAILRVRTDKNGVVSFEYVIVAACVVGAVVRRSARALVAQFAPL